MPAEIGGPDPLAFEDRAEAYDRWYEQYPYAYAAELAAIRELLGETRRGLEVGVGTGRFAAPLGLRFGIDPAASMLRLARRRGIQAIRGVGERLPFAAASFETVLAVAVVAFLSDPVQAFRQARRVLSPGGDLTLGVIDRGSPLWPEAYGGSALATQARFRRAGDVVAMLEEAGFELEAARQTIFEPLAEIEAQPAIREGAGEGLFAVLRAVVG